MSTKKDEKNERTSTVENQSDNRQQQQQRELHEQQEAVSRSLDETKRNIRQASEEAKREIPKYDRVVKDYQNQSIDATREIAETYLDSQKQTINSLQSAWNENLQQAQDWWANQFQPQLAADIFTRSASSYADASMAMSRIANDMVFANMEAATHLLNHARDNSKELARISSSVAGTYNSISTEARQRLSAAEEERRR
jgi:phytoene dehydrogenase-like protein